jgi:hypothetical protein
VRALERRHGRVELEPLPTPFEDAARRSAVARAGATR